MSNGDLPKDFDPNCDCPICRVVRGNAHQTVPNFNVVAKEDPARAQAVREQGDDLIKMMRNCEMAGLFTTAFQASGQYKLHDVYAFVINNTKQEHKDNVGLHFSNGFVSGFYHALNVVAALFPACGLIKESEAVDSQVEYGNGRAHAFERYSKVSDN